MTFVQPLYVELEQKKGSVCMESTAISAQCGCSNVKLNPAKHIHIFHLQSCLYKYACKVCPSLVLHADLDDCFKPMYTVNIEGPQYILK